MDGGRLCQAVLTLSTYPSWSSKLFGHISHIAAQTCNNGAGKLVYEKVADYKLSGTSISNYNSKAPKELVSRTDVPMRVLEECIRRCQEDRTTLIAQCLSFDFIPGKRRSSPFLAPPSAAQQSLSNALPGGRDQPQGPNQINALTAEYEESRCILYKERGAPDGAESLVKEPNSWHFNEVCLTCKYNNR